MSIIKKFRIFQSFLSKNQKNKFYIIVLLLIFQSLLEVIGVGMVIPILSLVIETEKILYSILLELIKII